MLRIGHGYDVHRLVEGRKLIIGGVEIPYEKGLLGHSDADVLLHAVSDAENAPVYRRNAPQYCRRLWDQRRICQRESHHRGGHGLHRGG